MAAPTVDDFIRASHRMAQAGLMRFSSGNLSWRIDDTQVFLTASRSWMERLTADDVVTVNLADGAVTAGQKSPSVESRFHLGILRRRPEVSVVLHFQSPSATALACSAAVSDWNLAVIPEIPYYIGPVGCVGFFMPGSEELAQATIDVMADHDLAMMQNHGLVVVGTSPDDVIQKAGFFELACDILLKNPKAAALSDEAITALTAAGRSGRQGC